MKRLFILLTVIILLTGCGNTTTANVSKVESTIYKTYNHTEQDINEVFAVLKQYFSNENTFFNCTLLTIEYGKYKDTTGTEENIKTQNNASEAMYLTFTFKTGEKSTILNSNQIYEYNAWAIKKDANWQIINVVQN